MVRQVMPEFHAQKNVIILCDSWYVKQNLVSVVGEYENLDLIGNARADSVIYDLAPLPTGKKGRPAKHGRRLSIDSDFILSAEKVGDYYTGYRRVLTNIFGAREVMAYVTCTGKENGTSRLFSALLTPRSCRSFMHGRRKRHLTGREADGCRTSPCSCIRSGGI